MSAKQETSGRLLRTVLPMLLLVAGNGIYQIAFEDRTTAFGGFGFDGRVYGGLVQDFPTEIGNLSPHRSSRLLPSAILYGVFQLIGIDDPDRDTVAVAFQILALCSLLLSVGLWFAISEHLKLGTIACWFGFLCLFVNYPNANYCYYKPVLTDTVGFLLAMMLAYGVFTNRFTWQFMALCLGAFANPSLFLFAAPFILFRRTESADAAFGRSRWPDVIAACVSVGFTMTALYAIYVREFHPYPKATQIYHHLLPLSLVIVAAYLFFAIRRLIDWPPLYRWRNVFASVQFLRCLAFVAIWVIAGAMRTSIVSAPPHSLVTSLSLLVWSTGANVPMRSVVMPGIFLAAHFGFFGPLVVFSIPAWKGICRRLHTQGYGFTLFALILVCCATTNESRHLLVAVPFLVPIVAMYVDDIGVSRITMATFAVSSWVTLGGGNRKGPWIRMDQYLWFAVSAVILGVVFWLLLRSRQTLAGDTQDVPVTD